MLRAQPLACSRVDLIVPELERTLSLRRADSVQSQLPADLRRSSCTVGMGFDQTLIGSGTDDARDALDRRVEFEVVACNELKCTR